MDYASMALKQQVDVMNDELAVVPTLTAKAAMWTQARTQLDEAAVSVGLGADHMEGAANWNDTTGAQFVANNRVAKKNLDTWVGQIDSSDIPGTFQRLGEMIHTTRNGVVANYNAAQQEIADLGPFAARFAATIEQKYVQLNAGLMTTLDGEYDKAATAVTQAAGGPDWGQTGSSGAPRSTAPGAQSPTGADPGAGADAGAQDQPQGQDQAQELAAQAQQSGQQAGGPSGGQQGAGDQGVAGAGGDPSLSGGLGAAPAMPTMPTMPTTMPPGLVPGANTPLPPVAGGPSPMLPLTPVAGLSALHRGGGGGGGGGGWGGGGGARIPGVGVSGGVSGVGSSSIPAAASPVSVPTVPTPAVAPAVPQGPVPATGSAGGPGGGGGVPPMMPPMGMGGAAAGGAGGGPGGPGAVSRPRNRKRDNGQTPGLPPMLSGKAGRTDPQPFVTRARTVESDIPTTVQLIDEDLWQVDDKAPAVVDQPTGRRVRH